MLIEDADRIGEAMGLEVWCTDRAGPYQTIPYPGQSRQPEGRPARQPHEDLRDGTAKAMTLSRPADGRVRARGVTACPNAVPHPWLKREPAEVVAAMPPPPAEPAAGWRAAWGRWQEGLSIKPTLLDELPPLRMLLALDNLAGHKTPELVCWLFAHGIRPLNTPVGGSWLNMAESLQRILKRRALDGRYPTDTAQIIAWYEAAARHRDAAPPPSSGAASGRPAGGGNASGVTASAARGHAHASPCRDEGGGVMATPKPHDPQAKERRLSSGVARRPSSPMKGGRVSSLDTIASSRPLRPVDQRPCREADSRCFPLPIAK